MVVIFLHTHNPSTFGAVGVIGVGGGGVAASLHSIQAGTEILRGEGKQMVTVRPVASMETSYKVVVKVRVSPLEPCTHREGGGAARMVRRGQCARELGLPSSTMLTTTPFPV